MKKKLIAIVTSLAMVATMVPSVAFAGTTTGAATKSVAQTQSLSTFEAALAKVPEANTITEANADTALSAYNLAEKEYQSLLAADMGKVTDAQKQKLSDVKNALVQVYADLMGKEIKKAAKAGTVSASTKFTDIETYHKKLTDILGLKEAEVKAAVGLNLYEWYDQAKDAQKIATEIQSQADRLRSDAIGTVQDAVDKLEKGNPPAIVTFPNASEGTRAMAENYNIYLEAKEKLAAAAHADTVLNDYTKLFKAQTALLVDAGSVAIPAVTAADADNAQKLLDEADGSIAVSRALDRVHINAAPAIPAPIATASVVNDYNTAHAALYNAIGIAETAIADKEAAAETSKLLDKVGVDSAKDKEKLLANLVNIQNLYDLKTNHSGDAAYTNNSSRVTAAVTAMTDYITAIAGDSTAKAELANAVADAYTAAIPEASKVTLDDADFLAVARVVLPTPTGTAAAPDAADIAFVGQNIGDYGVIADKLTAAWNKLTAAEAALDTLETVEKDKAVAFIVTVLRDMNTMPTDKAIYEDSLKRAQKDYEDLDPAYKKGGSLFEDPIVKKVDYTTATGLDTSVEHAYATLDLTTPYIPSGAPSTTANTYSLRTMQLNYQVNKDSILQANLFKELVDGIAALPATDKLTLDNKDAVYALQEKRDSMTEENQSEFKTNADTKDYNTNLNKAITKIDGLVADDVKNQIDALVKVKPNATAEEIAAAKAANKAAREAYDALTDSQKKAVTNYAFLQDAEAAVAAAEVQYAIDQMAAVLEGVDVDNMTLEQAKAILEVKDMIDDLTAAQKADIEKDKNYAAFQAAAKAARDVREENPSGPSDLIGVSKIATQVYTGKAITPNPVVKAEGKTLVKDTDYTVKYAKNTNIGEATVTISGIGAYKGTITTHFIIKPAKEKLTSVKAGKKQITLRYTAQKANGKTGYRIVYSAAKGQARAINAYTTKATVKGLKSGKTYKVKVRAFKTINGTQYTGTYSAVKKVKVK